MNILLVLAGSPPKEDLLRREIRSCNISVAVDGGYLPFHKAGIEPDLVLGDMDSFPASERGKIDVLEMMDQNQTDLQKALNHLLNAYAIKNLVILGGGGARTDHLMHNLHICVTVHPAINVTFKQTLAEENQFSLELIQRITPDTDFDLPVSVGDTLSVLPISNYSGLTSHGLHWEFANAHSSATFMSQSNRVSESTLSFELLAGSAYIAVYQ